MMTDTRLRIPVDSGLRAKIEKQAMDEKKTLSEWGKEAFALKLSGGVKLAGTKKDKINQVREKLIKEKIKIKDMQGEILQIVAEIDATLRDL